MWDQSDKPKISLCKSGCYAKPVVKISFLSSDWFDICERSKNWCFSLIEFIQM